MQTWAQAVIVACAVALTIVAVPLLLALRRAAERSERVLAAVERDLTPLIEHLRALVDEYKLLGSDVRGEIGRVMALAERAGEVASGVGRVLGAVAGLTRAGQLVGMVAGLKTGLDVFVHRLRKQEGDNHG